MITKKINAVSDKEMIGNIALQHALTENKSSSSRKSLHSPSVILYLVSLASVVVNHVIGVSNFVAISIMSDVELQRVLQSRTRFSFGDLVVAIYFSNFSRRAIDLRIVRTTTRS